MPSEKKDAAGVAQGLFFNISMYFNHDAKLVPSINPI